MTYRQRSTIGLLALLCVLPWRPATSAPDVASAPDYRDLVAMVEVTSPERFGAAIVVAQDHRGIYLVTAAHNVRPRNTKIYEEPRIEVSFRNKLKPQPAEVLKISPEEGRLDLALLIVRGKGTAILTEELRAILPPDGNGDLVGQEAKLIGYMNKVAWSQSGKLEEIREATADEIVMPSEYVLEGASGGPVISEHGVLVGMVHTDLQATARVLPVQKIVEALAGWGIEAQWTVNHRALATAAVKRLRDRGMLNVRSLQGILAKNDTASLKDLGIASAEIDSDLIAQALKSELQWQKGRSGAAEYFTIAKSGKDDYTWLMSSIESGLDPNLRLPHDYYEEESLLLVAQRADNSDAVRALLLAGASPHGYQNLVGTRYSRARFLFPLAYILEGEVSEDRKALARSFLKAGVVIPELNSAGPLEPLMFEIDQMYGKYKKVFSEPLKETPTLWKSSSDPICKHATARYGFDWCGFVRHLSHRVNFHTGEAGGNYSNGTGTCRLEYLLHVSNDSAYFLASFPVKTSGPPVSYVVVEAPRAKPEWFVYKYNYSGGPLGYCKPDANGHEPWSCWARYRAWPAE